MMKQFNMLALVVLLSVSLMGCTATQKWMTGGAVTGAVVGGVWTHNSSADLSLAQGSLIGAATGAAAGALVGSVIDYNHIKDLEKQIADLKAENQALKDEIARLKDEIARLKAQGVQMQATLLSDVLFKSGSARLTKEGEARLTEIAEKIKAQYGNSYVMVQGHTDSQPIKISKWDDNWQLGCARSLAVMRFLVKQGVNAERSSAETYGEYRPVVPNTSPENMAQNRRAVIVVRGVDTAVRGQAETMSQAAPAGERKAPPAARQGRRGGRRGPGAGAR
ncbi:MAG: OmpA family protein [Candidatus Sumerlaeia bacterium]